MLDDNKPSASTQLDRVKLRLNAEDLRHLEAVSFPAPQVPFVTSISIRELDLVETHKFDPDVLRPWAAWSALGNPAE